MNDTTSPANLLTTVTKLMAAYDRLERDDLPDGLPEAIDDVYAAGAHMLRRIEEIEKGHPNRIAAEVEELRRTNGALCFIPLSVLRDLESLLADGEEDAAGALSATDDEELAEVAQERLDQFGDAIAAVKAAYRTAH